MNNDGVEVYLGNYSLRSSSGADTGEPFLFMYYRMDGLTYFYAKEAGEHTASYVNRTEATHPIPDEYVANVVRTTEQTLTEAEQMQARANQGLYSTVEKVFVDWDGDTTGLERIATNTPPLGLYGPFTTDASPSDFIGAVVGGITITGQHLNETGTGLVVYDSSEGNAVFAFATEDGQTITSLEGRSVTAPSAGMWVYYISSYRKVSKTEVHPIPAEYLPVSRIVFKNDGGSWSCNVPYEDIQTAVLDGLPIIVIANGNRIGLVEFDTDEDGYLFDAFQLGFIPESDESVIMHVGTIKYDSTGVYDYGVQPG